MNDSDDGRRVLIIEPDTAGHHLLYVAEIAREALNRGHRVTIACPRSPGAPDAQTLHYIQPLRGARCEVVDVGDGNRGVFMTALRGLRQRDTERVIILDVDRWLFGSAAASLLTREAPKLRALIMRPRVQDSTIPARLRFLLKRVLATLLAIRAGRCSLAVLAVPGEDWLDAWPEGTVPVYDRSLVQPAGFDKGLSRKAFGIPSDAIVLGILGVLSARKNPILAIDAAALLAAQLGREVTLLCVGPDDEGLFSTLRSAPGVHLIGRTSFVSEVELSKAIAACDAVLCLYSNEGSSGIVSAAHAHGVPVVAAGAAGVKAMVLQLSAGSVAHLDPESVSAALTHELREPRVGNSPEEAKGTLIREWALLDNPT